MATSHSDTASLVLVKSMTYRGQREEWSNAYHLDVVPQTQQAWADLRSAVWPLEQAFLPVDVELERSLGYTPGTPPVLVFDSDENPPGQGGPPGLFVPGAAEHPTSGDVAGWVRWGTTQKTVRGKPIYLRNYYHGMYGVTDKDAISSTQVTAMNALGTAWVNGITTALGVYHRAGPRGAVAQNHDVSPYLTTRTLKARGKRKKLTNTLVAPGLGIPPGDYTIN